VREYADKAKETGDGIGEALVSGIRGAEDAGGEFVKTGKLGLRDLVTSILADLAKVSVRRFVLAPRTCFPACSVAWVRPSPACCTPAAWLAVRRRSERCGHSLSLARRGCTAVGLPACGRTRCRRSFSVASGC
jgi:hypothetical protein